MKNFNKIKKNKLKDELYNNHIRYLSGEIILNNNFFLLSSRL